MITAGIDMGTQSVRVRLGTIGLVTLLEKRLGVKYALMKKDIRAKS